MDKNINDYYDIGALIGAAATVPFVFVLLRGWWLLLWFLPIAIGVVIGMIIAGIVFFIRKCFESKQESKQEPIPESFTNTELACIQKTLQHIETYVGIAKRRKFDAGSLFIYIKSYQIFVEANFGDYPQNWLIDIIENYECCQYNGFCLFDWSVTKNEYNCTCLRYSYGKKIFNGNVINEIKKRCESIGLKIEDACDNCFYVCISE